MAHSPERDASSLEKEKVGDDEYREHAVGFTGDDGESAEFKKREKKLVKKLDVFIAPVMFLLMLISYLDRG
jgi:hypothetical protein